MNELKSYTEYAVSTPTADFVIGFDFNYGEDAVNVTVDDVPATEAGYTVVYLNETTIRLSPSVPSGVVRLQRETDIDQTDHAYRAGAKFIAQTMDENFEQLRHSQQEVRDGFSKLSTDTHEIIEGLDAALELAQDAAQDAQDAAVIAQGAADTVNTIIVGGKVGASNVLDASGETQQQVNYNGGSKWYPRVGGYKLNERVVLTNGDIVKSTIDGNTNDPNVGMTGWVKTNSAGQILDESGLSQQEINNNTAQPWYNKSGGYELNSSVSLDSGFNVISTIDENTGNPNLDLTGWAFNRDGYVTPQMFGAKGDGVSDDSLAFKRMVQYVVSKAFIPTVGSNRVLGMGMLIPATVKGYRIATPQSLIPNLGSTRYLGLSFVGVGLPMIHFDYDGDDYLAYNNNQFLMVSFRNIQFSCSSDTSKFLYSTAQGGAQDYIWDNCHWAGKWQKLYVLRGADNNSEWGWNKCGIAATIRDVVLDIADSDMFLNYWFNQCKLWLYDGQCVRASAGGHIKFINCDWSAIGGSRSMCQSTNGKYLFELTGRNHTRGACDFKIIGGRFECKLDSQNTGINARLLYCEWNQGNIELSVDMSSTIVSQYDNEFSILIHRGNNAGALLKVHDSYLIGKVSLQAFAAAYPYKNKAVFDSVTFGSVSLTKPTDFFDISAPSPNPSGGYAVELRNCRPSLGNATWNNTTRTTIPWDLTLGSKLQHSGSGTVNIAEIKGGVNGNNPISNNPCYLQLPANSTILGVKIWCDGTGTTANDSTWVVSDAAIGTALLTCASHKLNQRWYEENKIPYRSASGLLKLVDSAAGGQTQEIAGFKCVVEYVC